MAIIDLFNAGKTQFSKIDKPSRLGKDDLTSKVHYQYSLNGNPNIKNLPKPTRLKRDFGGKEPILYTSLERR